MKQLTTFGGRIYGIDDDEAENVKRMWADDTSEPIELRNGTMINPKGIESIGDIETEPYFMGNKMNKSMTRVFIQGEWKQFCGDKREIEMRPVLISNKLLQ